MVAAIRVIFNVHNPIEEEPGGMVLEFVLGSMVVVIFGGFGI